MYTASVGLGDRFWMSNDEREIKGLTDKLLYAGISYKFSCRKHYSVLIKNKEMKELLKQNILGEEFFKSIKFEEI